MSTRQDLNILRKTGQAQMATTVSERRTPKLTRRELFAEIIAMFEERAHEKFRTLDRIEYQTPEEFRANCSTGTVLEPIREKLNELGYHTEPNAGALMDRLELSMGQFHYVACYCHSGETMRGRQAADRLRTLMPRETFRERLSSLVRNVSNWWNG